MNAKKAKALRKVIRNAQQLNQNGPVPEVAYLENEKRRKYIEVIDKDKMSEYEREHPGEPVIELKKKVQVAHGQFTVAPKSARGIYLRLKKKLGEQRAGS